VKPSEIKPQNAVERVEEKMPPSGSIRLEAAAREAEEPALVT
jgi:hypothetical protein